MTNAETYMRDHERHAKARKELGKVNKVAIFDALAAANITEVVVEFNGEGDQGQIEFVGMIRNGERVDAPATSVTLRRASWGSDEHVIDQVPLKDAIETLCYDFLEDEHGGWENNDGAFGDFHFDVEDRTVHLAFTERYSDTLTTDHTF